MDTKRIYFTSKFLKVIIYYDKIIKIIVNYWNFQYVENIVWIKQNVNNTLWSEPYKYFKKSSLSCLIFKKVSFINILDYFNNFSKREIILNYGINVIRTLYLIWFVFKMVRNQKNYFIIEQEQIKKKNQNLFMKLLKHYYQIFILTKKQDFQRCLYLF